MPNEAYAVLVALLTPTGRSILSSRRPGRTSVGGSYRSSRVLSLGGKLRTALADGPCDSCAACVPVDREDGRRKDFPSKLRSKSGV